jgi:hypothetical protein
VGFFGKLPAKFQDLGRDAPCMMQKKTNTIMAGKALDEQSFLVDVLGGAQSTPSDASHYSQLSDHPDHESLGTQTSVNASPKLTPNPCGLHSMGHGKSKCFSSREKVLFTHWRRHAGEAMSYS